MLMTSRLISNTRKLLTVLILEIVTEHALHCYCVTLIFRLSTASEIKKMISNITKILYNGGSLAIQLYLLHLDVSRIGEVNMTYLNSDLYQSKYKTIRAGLQLKLLFLASTLPVENSSAHGASSHFLSGMHF